MKGVVVGPGIDGEHLPGPQHRRIEKGKHRASQQDGDHQQVVDGLFSLETDHAPGDQVFIRILPSGNPAVNNRVEHDQVKARKYRGVQKVQPFRGIGVKQVFIDGRRGVTGCRAQNDKKDA